MSMRLILAVALAAALAAPGAHGDVPSVGERRLAIPEPLAALRDHGEPVLHAVVWYPASGPEHEVDLGRPAAPAFLEGKLAPDAPFADAARHPLVVASHGFGGSAVQLAWLGAALARHGYVVVAVTHPGGSLDGGGMTEAGVYAPWMRADDLRAALDYVLADPALAPHIDAGRIGVAGFSLGGFTALLTIGARPDIHRFVRFCDSPQRDAVCNPQLEYPVDFRKIDAIMARPEMAPLAARQHADFRDPRIRAAFLIAPAAIQAFDPANLAGLRAPVEVVLGDADPIAPPATNGVFAARLIPGARLKVLPNVGHYDFLLVCGPATADQPICRDRPGVDRTQTHEAAGAEALRFFDEALGPGGQAR